ncbi:MAG TPA: hypothetical protein VJ723_06980, partial [Candidatus Angelobacter sp.]|nr:hypothetical protein [Candidatus Angelobacter sp.]
HLTSGLMPLDPGSMPLATAFLHGSAGLRLSADCCFQTQAEGHSPFPALKKVVENKGDITVATLCLFWRTISTAS